MSLESFMLKDEVKEIEYVASNRFKDKEGKVELYQVPIQLENDCEQ